MASEYTADVRTISMPARPHDSRHPSVYLDTSTLIYAFEAAQVGASQSLATARQLLPLVETIARRSNLVVSLFHLLEIADHSDIGRARATVVWLESLPHVWARSPPKIRIDEDEYWLKVAAGHATPTPVRVFAPSMISSFEDISVLDSAKLLGSPTMLHAFDEICQGGSLATRIKQDSLSAARTFNQNRAVFEPATASAADRRRNRQQADWRHGVDLRRRAMEAHQRLLDRFDDQYVSLGRSLNDVVEPFEQLFRNDPRSFPLSKIERCANDGFINTAATRTPGSKNFNKLDSSLTDSFHAQVGAAYCQLFTCDLLTERWLSSTRAHLGLPDAIVFSGDFIRFVKDLTSAWQNLV